MKELMKNLKKYPLIIYFGILLYAIAIMDLFSPVEERSELENRELATFPKFSFQQLFDNEYTPKIEDFTEDHFIKRDSWISLKSISESLLGKKENNGVVYGEDGYMFTKFVSTDYSQMEKNVDYINKFIERHSDRNVTVILAPTAPGVMSDKVLEGSPVIDTEYILGYAQENITVGHLLDVQDTLKSHSDEYIYYRTDHHWTTLGAWYAYAEYMEHTGRSNYKAMNEYQVTDVENFLGTHYSKAKNYNVQPDVLSYIESDAQIDIGGTVNNIYEKEKLEVRDKYAMFLRGNPGMATIKGSGTGKVMIIKDSYANCFVPFMTENYEQIDVYDMRYITMGLDRLIEAADYDEILFLYNCETFLSDKDLMKINMFN
ncbi:MAG: hypothetical protein IJ410_08245 [Oscillospiraceae bacterium]|nr:hypothetical protein [Oscillospiraceae bacterium]